MFTAVSCALFPPFIFTSSSLVISLQPCDSPVFKEKMLQSFVVAFLVFTAFGHWGNILTYGASLGDLQQQHATLRDVKEYIQPILYQKVLQAPGDSAVIQQAKTLVSEYLVDSLLDSVQDSIRPEQYARQTAANGTGPVRITISSGIAQGIRNITRPRPSQQHVLGQVDQILQNVNGGNITGIVDQALLIHTRAPVRQLVNGIMNLVLCNPLNRLWNRCAGGGGLFGGLSR